VKIKNRQKFLTILALSVVGLLMGDSLVITPLAKSWKDRSAKIEFLHKSIQRGDLLMSREKTIQNQWHLMEKGTLTNNMSAAENTVLKAVDRWTQKSRISFTSLKPQWKQNEEDHVLLECRADGYGDMQTVSRFLYELETDPLPLKIEDIELSTRDSDGRQIALGVRFSGLLLVKEKQ